MEVKIKKIYPDAILPTKAHTDDAGFDLYAHSKSYDENDNVVYGTGIAMEIQSGHVGLVFPRSSNAKKSLTLSNSVGVIDSGYRGEIIFKFKKHYTIPVYSKGFHDESAEYEVGERIGQIIIMPYPEVNFVEVEELTETERGTGGYGSSGK